MDISLRKKVRRSIVVELIILSFAICISVLAVTSSYQLLIFSEIRFPDIYYEFEGMYLLYLLLCVLGLIELGLLIHLFGFMKLRKSLSWPKSIFVIVIVHIFLGGLAFCMIKYSIASSNTSEVSWSFYIFASLFLVECGIMTFLLNRWYKTKEIA